MELFEYEDAYNLFELAKAEFSDNKDPFLLQSLNIMTKCYKDSPKQWIDDPERRKLLIKAKEFIDIAIDK
jgi:hypothetical protein